MLAKTIRNYVCCDDSTLSSVNLDITRILIKINRVDVLNEVFNVKIKTVEDSYGPLRVVLN